MNDKVVEWMIASIWTDDVRYFGTDKMLKEYEKEIQKHIKVKLLGVPGEFVGVDFIQNLELGTLELKVCLAFRYRDLLYTLRLAQSQDTCTTYDGLTRKYMFVISNISR